jgi:endonuclease/exonuclease/phosphatase (EEP) superfamily protein YafD
MRKFAVRWARLTGVALLGLCVASLAAALAPLGWPFELFAHFRWQLGAAALVLLLLAATLRRRNLLLLAGAAIVLQLAPLDWARMDEPPAATGCVGGEFGLATINLWYRNDDPDRVLQWLRSHPADVVVLQEVTSAWASALANVGAEYPHRLFRPREDPYGIGLLSRWPVERAADVDFAGDGLPSLVVTVDTPDGRVQVIALHTHWPVLKRLQLARDRGLDRAAQAARAAGMPSVLAGDLNLTPYAPAFHRLEQESRLRDAFAGRLWRPTWQAGFWPLALPIDHVFVPETACVRQAEIGPDVGSDHRPVRVVWRWR